MRQLKLLIKVNIITVLSILLINAVQSVMLKRTNIDNAVNCRKGLMISNCGYMKVNTRIQNIRSSQNRHVIILEDKRFGLMLIAAKGNSEGYDELSQGENVYFYKTLSKAGKSNSLELEEILLNNELDLRYYTEDVDNRIVEAKQIIPVVEIREKYQDKEEKNIYLDLYLIEFNKKTKGMKGYLLPIKKDSNFYRSNSEISSFSESVCLNEKDSLSDSVDKEYKFISENTYNKDGSYFLYSHDGYCESDSNEEKNPMPYIGQVSFDTEFKFKNVLRTFFHKKNNSVALNPINKYADHLKSLGAPLIQISNDVFQIEQTILGLGIWGGSSQGESYFLDLSAYTISILKKIIESNLQLIDPSELSILKEKFPQSMDDLDDASTLQLYQLTKFPLEKVKDEKSNALEELKETEEPQKEDDSTWKKCIVS